MFTVPPHLLIVPILFLQYYAIGVLRYGVHTRSKLCVLTCCVTTGNYRTASKYLLVIQRTQGMKMAHQLASKLLTASVADHADKGHIAPSSSVNARQYAINARTVSGVYHVDDRHDEYDHDYHHDDGVYDDDEWCDEEFDEMHDDDTNSASHSSSSPHHYLYQHRRQLRRFRKARDDLQSEITRFLTLTQTPDDAAEASIYDAPHTELHESTSSSSSAAAPLTANGVTQLHTTHDAPNIKLHQDAVDMNDAQSQYDTHDAPADGVDSSDGSAVDANQNAAQGCVLC